MATETDLRDLLEATERDPRAKQPTNPRHTTRLHMRWQIEGDHDGAEAEHRAVVDAALRILGPDNPQTLSARQCLAKALGRRGDHATAEAELRDVIEIAVPILGSRNPRSSSHRGTHLPMKWRHKSNNAAAEDELSDVLEAQEQVLGSDHPNTLSTKSCLARTRRDRAENEAQDEPDTA